jgi:hypothetical protein
LLTRLSYACSNGQIKLFGRDNTQALLQSPSPIPSKFLRVTTTALLLLLPIPLIINVECCIAEPAPRCSSPMAKGFS